MSDSQKKLIEYMKATAHKYGLDADFSFDWSNVGHVYIRKGLKTFNHLHFDFQSRYAIITFYEPEVRHSVNYDDNSRMDRFTAEYECRMKECKQRAKTK